MRKKNENGRFAAKGIIALAVMVIMTAGAFFAWWTARITERDMRADLLRKTRLLADAIHLKGMAALSGTEADLTTPQYLRFKDQLAGARHVFPNCRFLYLMGQKPDGAIFFFVDSEPEGSADESPAGQIYEEASEVTRRVFSTGRADTDGPTTDRWGTWVSALVPLSDPRTGKIMAIVGMDVDARNWQAVVMRKMILPIAFTVMLVIIVLAAAALLKWRTRLPAGRQNGWLPRHIETVITAAAGLALTLIFAYKAYDVQDNARRETFSRLVMAKAARITEAMRDIRTNQLEGLSRFFESSVHVEHWEFETYARYLTEGPTVQSWQWIPAIPAKERFQIQEEALRNGTGKFVIWERNAEGKRTAVTARNTYYPVFYVEPLTGNEAILGYDMGSEAKRRTAMETAARTGLITATDSIALLEEKETQKGIIVFRPIFGQQDHLQGFTACVLHIETILIRTVRQPGDREAAVILELFQLQAGGQQQFLASTSPEHASSERVESALWQYPDEAFTVIAPLFAYGKTYAVVAHPGPAFAGLYPVRAGWMTAAAGIALTSMLSLMIGFLGNRRFALEQQVLWRTAELRESEELFRNLFEYHAAVKVIIDPDTGAIIDANEAAENFYGWSREQLKNMTIQDINTLPPHEVKKEMDEVGQNNRVHFEFRHRLADGSIRDVEVFSSKINTKEKDFLHSVIHDITDRKRAEKALLKEKTFSETAINSLPGLFYLFDESGRIQQWNRNFEKVSGYSPEEIEKMNPLDFFPEENKQLVADVMKEVFVNGDSRVEADFVSKDGRRTPYYFTGLRFVLDNRPYLVGMGIDITERKLAEEEHRLNESRISALLELSRMAHQPDQMLTGFALEKAIELTGSEIGYLAFMNEDETVLTMYSWSRQAMQECMVEQKPIVYPVETTGLWGEAVRQRKPVITNDYQASNPLKKGYPEGHVQVIRHMNIPLFDRDRIVLVAGVGNKKDPYGDRDIQELTLLMDGMWKIIKQKRAEDALMESEKRYRLLFENATDAIFIAQDERIKFPNPRLELLSGYTTHELTGMSFLDFVYLADRDMVLEKQRKMLRGDIFSATYSFRFITKSGEDIWVELSNVIIEWQGRPATLNFLRDITQQKKMEAQLFQAQKMEAIGQLAGGLAHDFNNLLTAIIGYGHLLQNKVSRSESTSAYVDHILSAAERAAILTNDLLTFSRKQIVNLQPVDLNKIIKNMEGLLSRVIGEDIELSTILADTELTIMADSTQIDQILMNLATNAKDAMLKGGSVLIRTDRMEINGEYIKAYGYGNPGSYALLSVEDTGTGMDEMIKGRIFEPFFTTKDVGKGTGLGLAMVYGIVKQHDGYINVYSEIGKGTTFKILLPLIQAKVQEIRPEDSQKVKGGTETILIAEDDQHVRKLLIEILSHAGYHIMEAVDGEDAVKVFHEHRDKIDLLTLDVIMPKKNGKEVYAEIKKVKPAIKVIFVSGYSADIMHKKGLLEVGLNFVSKPVLPDELLLKIRNVLDK
ncbi:MAG: PAS domain S-box protein [Thermodesulfovibrionales bacterium]|nr:PAS domain S-box protein [Thermodesulfovibrionales bacterium]